MDIILWLWGIPGGIDVQTKLEHEVKV